MESSEERFQHIAQSGTSQVYILKWTVSVCNICSKSLLKG